LVLIVEDPDAPGGTFIHWLLYDIPIKITSLPEGIPKEARVKDIGFQGINDFEEIGYNGPCPPVTHKPHRYYFNLYAIKEQTGLKEGAKVRELMRKIQGKTMEKASYMGIYGRRR
jgi:Raf kinase inhibitor-like protein, YbhB/YbcL family